MLLKRKHMKKPILVAGLMLVVSMLCASLGWTSVRTESYGSAVDRIVIELMGEGDPIVSKSGEGIQVKLRDYAAGSQATINHNPSALVLGIKQTGALLTISISGSFCYEQSSYNNRRRLVLDVFRADPDKAQRLQIAGFYGETGKLNSADKAYNALHTDYRQDMQILYNWALLLHKRGSVRATEKLSQIPQESSYFQQAQKLLAKIHGDEEPLPPAPVQQTNLQPEAGSDSVAVKDTIISAPEPSPVVSNPPQCPFQRNYLPILIGLAVLLAIVIIVFSFGKKKSPQPRQIQEPHIQDSDSALDTKTMCRMVSKLLADGWTQREIARELKISQREVENYVQLCHQGGHEDHED